MRTDANSQRVRKPNHSDLTQVERDCLRISAGRAPLRLFSPRRRGVPPRWAPSFAGPHFFPGTVAELRRRRLLHCEAAEDGEICFASPEGLQALATLPPDEQLEEIAL